jgi:SAM-dependent methyltransferase
MNEPMTEGLELKGKLVIEAMCGSGQTTEYLLAKGARVVGVDISEREIEHFRRRWPACHAHCASILDTGLPSAEFDAIFVVGGLHHVHPSVPRAVDEICRLLKPGGHFCFVEPHCGSVLDRVRSAWYRRDPYFAENEASVDVEELKEMFAHEFEFIRERYQGGMAYQFVLNSMIWRIPLWLKPWYSPGLLALERLTAFASSRLFSCFVVAQWRKRSDVELP